MLVDDVAHTVAFYCDVLGFELVMQQVAGAAPSWALLKRGDLEVMFQARCGLPGAALPALGRRRSPITLYLDVPDVEVLYERLPPAVCVVQALHTTRDGRPEFSIEDCNGFILTFAGAVPAAALLTARSA